MEDGISRIGVSLPRTLLEDFDNIIKKRGYSSRSEAIRDAIRAYIAEYRWLESEKGEIAGAVVVVYNHKTHGVSDTIINLQHEFSSVVTSSMHVHLNQDQCLELILVRGEMEEIKKLVDRISVIRGVLNIRLISAMKELRG